MKATEVLSSEHRVILHVLQSLNIGAEKLRQKQSVRPGSFLEAVDFITSFADGCHHHQEEGVLFEAMIQHGMPRDSGPIGVMLYEHEQGRLFTRKMREAASRFQTWASTRNIWLLQRRWGKKC